VSLATADVAASSARIFWATWLGWMLDGFDAGIYIYMLAPAVKELLAHDRRPVTTASVALYGGYFFSIFMLGWACSMVWGWLADRAGRVKVMCLTIITYSVFTALCGLAPGLLLFAVFRFLAGFGIGGEWSAGVSLLHESLPEEARVRYAGWLHTATPTGGILAAAASFLYPVFGWRGLFFLGLLPAVLTIYLKEANSRTHQVASPNSDRKTWRASALPASFGAPYVDGVGDVVVRDSRPMVDELLGACFRCEQGGVGRRNSRGRPATSVLRRTGRQPRDHAGMPDGAMDRAEHRLTTIDRDFLLCGSAGVCVAHVRIRCEGSGRIRAVLGAFARARILFERRVCSLFHLAAGAFSEHSSRIWRRFRF